MTMATSGRAPVSGAEMRARAHPTYVVQPGQLFIPMHYAECNQLTMAVFDPYSRQPSEWPRIMKPLVP